MSHKSKHQTSPWVRRHLRVLVDMDGVLCDFEGWFLQQYKHLYPNEPFIELKDRNTFYVNDQYKDIRYDLGKKSSDIIESEGFFRNLPPIEGAIECIKELSGMEGVDVFICTSPLTNVSRSVKEKFDWVAHYLGHDWVGRMVVAKDKTIVSGDILIDDRPKINGVEKTPSWDHILFTSCHNKTLKLDKLKCKHRLDSWTDGSWRNLILEYKKQI